MAIMHAIAGGSAWSARELAGALGGDGGAPPWRRLILALRAQADGAEVAPLAPDRGGEGAAEGPSPPARPRPLATDPDRALLLEVLAEYPHGTEAFTRLVGLHWGRTWATCQAVLLNPADAEEATQDAFLKAHRYLAGFRFESRFGTWLHRIARNVALDLLASRRREHAARAAVTDDPVLKRSWSPWRSPDPTPRHQTLRRALAEIPAADRLVLVLREMQGAPYEEIAELLELEPGAVRMRATRARRRLREALERLRGEGG